MPSTPTAPPSPDLTDASRRRFSPLGRGEAGRATAARLRAALAVQPGSPPAAATAAGHRSLVPAVLLVATGLAFGGLAVAGHPSQAAVPAATVARAASFAVAAVAPGEDVQAAASPGFAKPLDLLDGGGPTTVVPPVVVTPPRASRAHRPAAPRYVRPGVGTFTSGFGMRWGRMHEGIDLAGPYGSPIRAVTNGVVGLAGEESGYGVVIKLADWDGTESVYGHLSQLLVQPGQRVSAGDVIGLEGNSGHSTGPHLHFEIRINGVALDPAPWLRLHGVYV